MDARGRTEGITGRHGGIQAIGGGEAGLIQHMTGDGRQHVRAGEFAVDRAAVQVEGVEREDVMMHDAVVPGRAGSVIAEIVACHGRVAGEPFPVVVDALPSAAGSCRAGFAAGGHALGKFPGLDLRRLWGQIDQDPVIEIGARQVGGHLAAFLIDVVGARGHVPVVADQYQGAGAGR